MFNKIFGTALLGFFVATAAIAAPDTMVKTVEVNIELTAMENKAAAARFATMQDDLQNALTARLANRFADEGVKISVDISAAELSNSYTEQMGLADTRLVGNVVITDETNNTNFDAYILTVDINSARSYLPEGVDVATLPKDSSDYYNAMIAAFAHHVVLMLDK